MTLTSIKGISIFVALLFHSAALTAFAQSENLKNNTASLTLRGTNTTVGQTTGSRIVFGSSRNNGNHDIFVMDADGSNQTRLTTSLAYDDQPKWNPNGTKIVFMSGRDGNFEIYSMNADGSNQTRLTNNPAADGFPAWSPDGTRIAFVRGNLNDPNTFELFVMNADGTNPIQLTNDALVDAVPSWSPDSSKLVFMSGPSIFDPNNFEIFTIKANGSDRVRLTNNSVIDGQPSYSPDGSKILFGSGDVMNPTGIEIFVMDSDGSNRTQLTTNSVTDGFPTWTTDGSHIVFASGSVADETTVELFVMNANGSNQTRLTDNSVVDWFPNVQIGTPPAVQLSAATFTANEGSTSLTAIVTRTGDTAGTSAVKYATSDTAGSLGCSVVNNVASARCDYLTTIGTLNFAAGETAKEIKIPVIDDVYAEGLENFTLTLSNVVGATLGAPSTATLTISDNETVNGINPIDTASFFVRQHYIDFLNREPDAGGLAFWSNEITSCGANVACLEVKRINVSAAFFLSIEFQETGYLVYRIYKTGFGNLPGTPIPILFADFLKDNQQIGQGVQVGIGSWEAILENNKQAFALAFVQRTDFQAAFPIGMTADQFVTKLDVNAGGVLSPAEKTNLIAVLGATPSDPAKRASVLRAVAEDSDLRAAEFNRAFVLMQYFGYLRRNPNDPPDADFGGYNFWLGKLNSFGNFVDAELVKAFILSGEYRQRFGP